MALDITRLSGGNTPADGSDPRTFPAIWNETSDALEALELDDLTGVTVTSPTTGQVLEYDGSAWVNVDAEEVVSAPGDNLIYNGAMQVAQRGTSETGITGTSYFTADRWLTLLVTLGTFTQTIEDDGPTGSGFAKSLKMECTTADAAPASGDLLVISQRLEGYDLQGLKKGSSSAESLTLSFWVKSNVTGTYVAELDDADNGRNISASYTISSSGTWEKKTITFDGDTTGVLDADNARSLSLAFWLGAGSNFTSGSLQTSWGAEVVANRAVGQTNLAASTSNYWQVTGVQLEAGTVATSFEHKPYGVEFAECQRYTFNLTSQNLNYFSTGTYYNSSTLFGLIQFPTTMRVAPTLDAFSGTDAYVFDRAGTNDRFNSFTIVGASTTSCALRNNTEVSGSAGDSGVITTNSSGAAFSGSIIFDAEL